MFRATSWAELIVYFTRFAKTIGSDDWEECLQCGAEKLLRYLATHLLELADLDRKKARTIYRRGMIDYVRQLFEGRSIPLPRAIRINIDILPTQYHHQNDGFLHIQQQQAMAILASYPERIVQMILMVLDGMPLKAIAQEMHLSPARISQLMKQYLPDYPIEHNVKRPELSDEERARRAEWGKDLAAKRKQRYEESPPKPRPKMSKRRALSRYDPDAYNAR